MSPTLSAVVASITAFDQDGTFDADAQRGHFRRLAEAGVTVLVGSSGAGEGYSLTDTELRALFQIARDELKGRVRCDLMGMEAHTAEQMIRLHELARPYDFDAMHVHCVDFGHGKKPRVSELEGYFRDILDVVDIPCWVSSEPGITGYEIPVELMKRLVLDYPQVIGIQDTSGDVRGLSVLRSELGDRLELATTLGHILSGLAIAGATFLSNESNLVPQLCHSLVTSFRAGDYELAIEGYRLLVAVHEILSEGLPYSTSRLPAPVKAALRELSLPGGYVRRPRIDLSPDESQALANRLRTLDIAELAAVRDHRA
jgi:4-hydroxy-tetrahydrodipicolinate synthase